MKPVIAISLCLAIAGCADSGFDFDPVSTVIPSSSEVKSLDDASTSKLYLSVVNGLLEQGRYHAALAYLDQYAVQEKKTPYFTELYGLAIIHISEPTRLRRISYAVFCLKKKKKHKCHTWSVVRYYSHYVIFSRTSFC